MFTALQTLLATVAGLSISIVANKDDTITVTVIPKAKKEGGDAALNTPLQLTGTAAELDAEFVGIVANYSNKRMSLSEQLEATESILEAAKKEASTKATKAIKKGSGATAPATSATSTETSSASDDGDEEPADSDSSQAAHTAGEAKPAAAADDNLFA